MSDVKYPFVIVKLTGTDGNAFSLMALVSKALKRVNVSADEIKKFREEAMSGDYDNLLQTCMKWVTVR